MRADRLVSLVLLLRQRGRMTASALAAELEVSTRTVLRDIEALSTAGVPVYVDRGRHGGFSLLPGFRTELTGLSPDEAVALITAGRAHTDGHFGMSASLAAAMLKVRDALPDAHRQGIEDASARFLVEPATDLLSRPRAAEEIPPAVLTAVRRAVVEGLRLRIEYAAPESPPTSRTVDPLGLVTVRGRAYLLATVVGADRTYRLSRVRAAEVLPDAAVRPADVDLAADWERRSARFLADARLDVDILVASAHRDELLAHVRAVRESALEHDGRTRMTVSFEDERHAVWALWGMGPAVEVLAPEEVRRALHDRAAVIAARYAGESPA
ncbi:helix-turn-helix transcriptional regulator [Microbacterium gorillae]|uniref:helix-turn-helix transcriptional regulator n=1 Tax=Microbacterium gorillae TaxID=1231063 RepID=UPI000590B242|nr:WYL domain-containing protein [Microbacterium gorillae]